MFFNARRESSSLGNITPIASSIVIKSVTDMQTKLAAELDKHIKAHPVPGPKMASSAEITQAWRSFPRSCEWYTAHIKRLADISASVRAEQAVAELILQWLPPAFGSAQPGQAFMRSQFVFTKFTQRLECLNAIQMGLDRKELAAKQQEEARNMEVAQTIVCIAVCDVLAALIEPRPGHGSPIDPDLGHICVQLAFAQFNPQNDRTKIMAQSVHSSVAVALTERTVVSWGEVVSHLAQVRYEQIVNEFIGRIHPAKTADDVFHILVGTQRVTMPSMAAPASAPFFDQFRQIVTSDKKLYRDSLMRLCVTYSLELLVRQADCGAIDVDPDASSALYDKLHAMFLTLQEWAEKPDLMMATTQLLALIVCHSPPAFWQAHMDTSKEGKKRSNQLLGGKKEGLLRLLLTDQAYDEKSSRAALCGVLRLLTGGYPLPTSIIGKPSDAEWWRTEEKDHMVDGSLMRYTMRTFGPSVGAGTMGDLDTNERLRFVVEKLFQRKASGRLTRLPRLLECGDVLVYIVGQIAAHDLQVGIDAIELLLADPRDPEYNLLGVCALGRVLRAPNLAAALVEQMNYFADRLQTVIERCEATVGSHAIGLAQRTLPIPSLEYDDSVQLLLTNVGKKKDREIAVRLAMYREAIGCITLALPPMCLQPHAFVGELVLHADEELALMASRAVQRLTIEQPQRRKDLLQCFAKMLLRILSEPGGSNLELRGAHHAVALEAMEARLQTVVEHVTSLLDTWATALPNELVNLEPIEMELIGSQVVRLEQEMAEIDVAAIALLAHPASSLRSAGLKLTRSTRGLFYARKAAYDRAVSDRLAFLTSNHCDVPPAEAEREIIEAHQRISRVELVEGFAADVIDSTAPTIVRKAIKRELLESKGGVGSEMPSDVQLEKMQIPPFEKLFALPAESLSMTSQFCFCLAELGAAFLASGCARRAGALRDMLASALQRLPGGIDLARFISEGDTKLGVLWRNYYSLLLSVAGGTISATTRMLHPDNPELKQAALNKSSISGSPAVKTPPVKSQPGALPPPPIPGAAHGPPKTTAVLPPPPLVGSGHAPGQQVVLPPPPVGLGMPGTDGRPASFSARRPSGKMPPPLPASALEEDDDTPSKGSPLRSSQRNSGKFDKEIGGLEVGWSKSRSGSMVYDRDSISDALSSGTGPGQALPENFNLLVSAELGGPTSAELATRLAGAGPAPNLPSQGLVGAAPPPPPMLSQGSGRNLNAPPMLSSGGAPPPPLSAGAPPKLSSRSYAPGGVPPPPTLSQATRGSLAPGGVAPPPTLGGLSSPPPSPPASPPPSPPASPPPSPPASPPSSPARQPMGIAALAVLPPAALTPPSQPPPSPPPSPPSAMPAYDLYAGASLAGGRAVVSANDIKQVEVMITQSEQAIKPVVDALWQSLALDASGAVGWAAMSVGTIASCLHHHGALMATESLFSWRESLRDDKKRKELLLPMARTLRTIAQSDGFRDAVLADADKSEHQRLLQLYLSFIREHTALLAEPNNVARRPFCLELILIVSHVARATTTAIRYDATRWLKPNFVPETLKHAWPLKQRADLLEYLIQWATWREEEAWRAAQELGTGKGAMKKQMNKNAKGPQVGSDEERLLYRIETTASQAVKHVTKSGPISAERWLSDGGSWELEPIIPPPRDPSMPGLRRRQTVAFFEKAELEGSETLRYVLGHHFPMLLDPYLRHAYYEPATSSVYFHAILDAIIPQDGEAICEEVHAYEDNIFSQEIRRHAPKLMLLALVHLKADDAKIRSRAFDLTCRLTSSFCDGGRPFTCDGRPLAQFRPLYTASLPAPVLLRHHIRALLKAAASQCSSLGAGVIGEALGLLMQTFPEHTHLEQLPRSQVLAVMQVAAPWFVNVPLRTMPPQEQQHSAPFIFLRRWAIIGIARDGVDGEALSAYYDAWLHLSAATVGVTAAMRAPPCAREDEKAPPNVPIILEFLLHVAGRSDFAMELSQQLVLGLFTLAPHTTLDMLLSQISTGRMRAGEPQKGPMGKKRPSLLETFGSMITDTFRKKDGKNGVPQLTSESSVLELGGPMPMRAKSISSSRPPPVAAPSLEPERVVVTLRRGANGGLGLGLNDANRVTELGPGSPAATCGQILAGDRLVSVNGSEVGPQQAIGPLLPPRTSDAPIEFVFMRELSDAEKASRTALALKAASQDQEAREAAAARDVAEAAARDAAIFGGDDGDGVYQTTADEQELLAPSGGLEETGDPPVLASSKEQRASALQLMVEPIRQGFCDPCGKRALVDSLPVMLTMLLTLFDSQTVSKLSVEERNTLRSVLGALLTGVLEARRAATGAAAAPFSEAQEKLPEKYAALLAATSTKGFKIRWPRLFADATASITTPTVANAYEITNFLPVGDAIVGLLECVEDWGKMHIVSEWAAVARSWLDASTDTIVRFKTLATLRLLLPHLPNEQLDANLISSAAGALYSGLEELQKALAEETEEARQQLLDETVAAEREPHSRPGVEGPRRGSLPSAGAAATETAGSRAPMGRKPPALALAEEALCMLHDIAKRKEAADELHGGLGGTLVWTAVGLCGTIYPTLLAELYPMLTLLLGSEQVRRLVVKGDCPPPPPRTSNARDPFAPGLLQMLLEGLRAAGWWGPKQTARSGHSERRHLLPVSLQSTIVLAVRHASAIHAEWVLPQVVQGPAVVPDPKGGSRAYGASTTPLLECLMLQLPAMYELIASSGVITEGQRVAYEGLTAAANVIDKMLGAEDGNPETPSMMRALDRFFSGASTRIDGAARGDPRAAAADMLNELCQPLFAAFLPSHSVQLAGMLTRLLQAGPITWEEPLMLLVAYALQHPQAPSFINHFHLVVQLCVNGDSEAAVYCLSSAMQAAARGGDTLTSADMSSGKPFDEIANLQFYETEGKELEQTRDVLPGMQQVLDVLRT